MSLAEIIDGIYLDFLNKCVTFIGDKEYLILLSIILVGIIGLIPLVLFLNASSSTPSGGGTDSGEKKLEDKGQKTPKAEDLKGKGKAEPEAKDLKGKAEPEPTLEVDNDNISIYSETSQSIPQGENTGRDRYRSEGRRERISRQVEIGERAFNDFRSVQRQRRLNKLNARKNMNIPFRPR